MTVRVCFCYNVLLSSVVMEGSSVIMPPTHHTMQAIKGRNYILYDVKKPLSNGSCIMMVLASYYIISHSYT